MLFTFDLKTLSQGLTDITSEVTEAVSESGVYEGICIVFCPHTTASVMIKSDVNSVTNTSETVIISGGKPLLSEGQRIYFCEHSELEIEKSVPKNRRFYVKIV